MTAVAFNAAGGVGCISVVSNIAPALCAEMQNATLKGDYATALKIQDRLVPLHDAAFREPGLAGPSSASRCSAGATRRCACRCCRSSRRRTAPT